jgi:hypothetical protein
MDDLPWSLSVLPSGFPQMQGFVSSSLTDHAFLALSPEANHLYVSEHATGSEFMRLLAEPGPYISHEARYFRDRVVDVPGKGSISGVWVVVSRVDQLRLQALSEDAEVVQRYRILDARGQLFTENAFSLRGTAEQIRLLHSSNIVHEDPVAGHERGESTVLLRFSDSGQALPLDQVVIQAAHGRISDLRYALAGMTNQEVLDYLDMRVKIRVPSGSEQEARLIDVWRSTLVEGVYRADQAALQALDQGQQLEESGFSVIGLGSHSMAASSAHARIVLQGKAEPEAHRFAVQLDEAGIADGDGAMDSVVIAALDMPGGVPVRFIAPPADGGLTSGGVPVRWQLDPDHQELRGVSGGKDVLRLRIETESGGTRVHAQLMAGLDHSPASPELEPVVQLAFGPNSVTGVLSLGISDDQPVVDPRIHRTPMPSVPSNLVIVLDVSCLLSGARGPGWQQYSPQDAALSMMHKLLSRYESMGETRVHFVLYGLNDQGHSLMGSGWSAEGALYVNPFWASSAEAHSMLSNGGFKSLMANSHMPAESYDPALRQVMEIFRIDARVQGDEARAARNEVVLISAGQPQYGLSGSVLQEWEQFVAFQRLSVRALGLNGCSMDSGHADYLLSSLQQIASEPWPGGGKNARLLLSEAEIDHALATGWSYPLPGVIAEQPLGRLGADGGHVSEIAFAGLHYQLDWEERSLNGYRDHDWHAAQPGWEWRFDAHNRALHFRSATGQIQLYLDEARYGYRSHQSGEDAPLILEFTLTDGDGDQCAGRLLLDAAGGRVEALPLPPVVRGGSDLSPVSPVVPEDLADWPLPGRISSVEELESMFDRPAMTL